MYPQLCRLGDGWTEGDWRKVGGAGEDPGTSVSSGRPAGDGEVVGPASSLLALPPGETEGASESLICLLSNSAVGASASAAWLGSISALATSSFQVCSVCGQPSVGSSVQSISQQRLEQKLCFGWTSEKLDLPKVAVATRAQDRLFLH